MEPKKNPNDGIWVDVVLLIVTVIASIAFFSLAVAVTVTTGSSMLGIVLSLLAMCLFLWLFSA